MISEYQIRVLPQQAANEQSITDFLVREKGVRRAHVCALRVIRRSIDARQRQVYVNLTVRLFLNEQPAADDDFARVDYCSVEGCPAVVVVGAGPAGLFAALRLIELRLRPIVIERGKNVRDRKKDIAQIARTSQVQPESNYCFGEGGAGAYSDGKLYTRSKKRGDTDKILRIFCQHGASPSILCDAHPHIGTDKLPRVIENMRNTIVACGGEVHFETRMEQILVKEGVAVGVTTHTGDTFEGPVILATGHSARDVYRTLHSHGIELQMKGIAVGVRLEHPSQLIDSIQYHSPAGRGLYLPAAEYSFTTQVGGRGVYSFCMCPGGFVIPAANGSEQLVVNGMSPSGRNSRWSNSGMVVQVNPEDLGQLGVADESPLAMMQFQEQMERQCWMAGNRRQTAPAQRMADFVHGRLSSDLPSSSYAPGLIASPLHFWMPSFVHERLRRGFEQFGRSSRGFLTNEATVIGVETRTSSPVRIVRRPDTLQHPGVAGLFPCGEGAGYAGGIVSAGVDGERCAEAAADWMRRI